MPSNPSNTVGILEPTIPVDQSIYETSTTQKTRLGTRLKVGDRVFRYAQLAASSNEVAGTLVCEPLALSSYVSAVLTVSAATTGATSISVTGSAAITAGVFNEGYLSIASTALAGGGLVFRVKNQASGGATIVLTLYDPIPSSIGAGPCSLVPNAYKAVKPDDKTIANAAGVLPVNVTTGEYFWVQTWGPASPRHSAATPAGAALMLGTAGCVEGYTAGGASSGERVIGMNSNLIAVATQCCPVQLCIQL